MSLTITKNRPLQHTFDASLDAHPELKALAKEAAEYMDTDAEVKHPTRVQWELDPPATRLTITLRDVEMDIVAEASLAITELQGQDRNYLLLRLWGRFLQRRTQKLITKFLRSVSNSTEELE